MTVTAQLELFGHAPTSNAEAGIRKAIPAGPGRLVAALVKGGLHEADLPAAAALVLALDEGART